jgi:hypothetical protein
MKPINPSELLIISTLLTTSPSLVLAQADAPMESVGCRTNRTLLESDGQLELLKGELSFAHDIKVFTNCTFQVNNGKTRSLEEGQRLRADGNLLQADGSIQPAYDHIAMIAGAVRIFRDGEGQALDGSFTMPDGSIINPDGNYTRPSGRRSRLVDGQILALDGTALPSQDTITLRDGRVVVSKSGTLFTLQANQIMGLDDGRRVRGDGTILERDGSSTKLEDGQTMVVEGLKADW